MYIHSSEAMMRPPYPLDEEEQRLIEEYFHGSQKRKWNVE